MLSNVKFEVLFRVNSFYLFFFYGTKVSSNPLHGKNSPCCNSVCRPVTELVTAVVTAAADTVTTSSLAAEVTSPEFPFEMSCCWQ